MQKETKLKTFICFTFLFFVLELVSGYYSGSVALVADAFHMFSDVSSLIIALYATRMAKSKSTGVEFSFGLQRAEVLGALINGVTLLALSFTLIIEALDRFFMPEPIDSPLIVLYVGSAGLVVNLVGIFLFHDHSHAHHGHSHPSVPSTPIAAEEGGDIDVNQEIENPIHLSEKVIRVAALIHERRESSIEEIDLQGGPSSYRHDIETGSHQSNSTQPKLSHDHKKHSHSHDHDHDHDHSDHSDHGHDHDHDHGHSHGHSHADMNMQGVFLHILGDLLASVGVIGSTLIIIFVKEDWTKYMDPLMSLFITGIIIFATVPLVRSASYILLQRTPSSVSVEGLRQDILSIPGVLGVHELHVWQLSEAQTIASVHVVVPKTSEKSDIMDEKYMELASLIKNKLHLHGVHSTTVQPEFTNTIVDSNSIGENGKTCLLQCTSRSCRDKICCPTD